MTVNTTPAPANPITDVTFTGFNFAPSQKYYATFQRGILGKLAVRSHASLCQSCTLQVIVLNPGKLSTTAAYMILGAPLQSGPASSPASRCTLHARRASRNGQLVVSHTPSCRPRPYQYRVRPGCAGWCMRRSTPLTPAPAAERAWRPTAPRRAGRRSTSIWPAAH